MKQILFLLMLVSFSATAQKSISSFPKAKIVDTNSFFLGTKKVGSAYMDSLFPAGKVLAFIDSFINDTGGISSQTLQQTLIYGNTTTGTIKMGKSVGSNPYGGVWIGPRASDSSGQIIIRPVGSSNRTTVINIDSALFRQPVYLPYIVGVGNPPTVSLNACMGTGATYTVTPSSTHGRGKIAITAGTSPCAATNVFFYINYPTVMAAAPLWVNVVAGDDNTADWVRAGNLPYYQGGTTSTASIGISTSSGPNAGTVYTFIYHIE